MQSRKERSSKDVMDVRRLKTIHSCHHEPELSVYHIEVSWEGDSTRESIVLP
jgi:hypothetical protein